jgi:hypothetical protein
VNYRGRGGTLFRNQIHELGKLIADYIENCGRIRRVTGRSCRLGGTLERAMRFLPYGFFKMIPARSRGIRGIVVQFWIVGILSFW